MLRTTLLITLLAFCTSCASDIFLMIEQNKTAEVDRLLFKRPSQLRIRDHAQRTPLHTAAYLGRTDMVKILLNRGANWRATDKSGLNPVQLAVSEGHADITELFLMKTEVSVNAPYKDRVTLLDFAMARPDNDGVIAVIRKYGGKTKEELSPK